MIPALGSTGVYVLAPPFEVSDELIYRCDSVTGFSALRAAGINVYDKYYEPVDLTPGDYARDSDAGEFIVTLIPKGAGSVIHVPTSYIRGAPTVEMVPYNKIVLSIDLGLLPDALELETLMEDLSAFASDVVGVTPITKLHQISVKGGVDVKTHNNLENARKTLITHRTSVHAENGKLTRLLDERNARIALLEAALIAARA